MAENFSVAFHFFFCLFLIFVFSFSFFDEGLLCKCTYDCSS